MKDVTEEQSREFFKTEETARLFRVWVNNFPESFNLYDMERWTEFVLGVLEDGEELNLNHIDEKLSLNLGNYPGQEECDDPLSIVDYYMGLYGTMKRLYDVMKKKGYKKSNE
jgi:hypothetical protein